MNKGTTPRARCPRPPDWHPDERELWFHGRLIMRFRQRASCQELLVISFFDCRWKHVIDDPLPHLAGKDPKRRLCDAICNFNRRQITPLLHLFADGTGKHVGWQTAAEHKKQKRKRR